MTERPDEHRLLAQYLAEIQKKPLLTHAQELALGEQKNAGAKARQQLASGSFVTREEGMVLAEHMRAGDQAHTALVEGRLAAAYLDVTEPEPLPPSDPLWTTPNCYITPHSSGGHANEWERLVLHFLANLRRFEQGEALVNRVF